MKMRFNRLLLLGVTILSFACAKDKAKPFAVNNCTTTSSYANDIQPVLDVSCSFSGCHSSVNPADGIALTNYAEVSSESMNSRFLMSIKHQSGVTAMPFGGSRLPDSTIQKIECWIDAGSPNN